MQRTDCRHCGHTFYKFEHLKRHERIHTGSRPFVCSVCNRAFGRQDSLFRHKRLHLRTTTQPYASPSPSAGILSGPEDGLDSERSDAGDTVPPMRASNTLPYSQLEHLTRLQSQSPIGNDLPGIQEQVDHELIWPDSENLFQTIQAGNDSQHINPGVYLSHPSPGSSQSTTARFGDQALSIDVIPKDGSNQAVHVVSDMIHQQSSIITSVANMNAINSLFLDECLHMFFVRFIPTFPVLHRPTFVFRDCLRPLLLNAIAIGSLYLGHVNAVAQGEMLWRLAHTALATLWPDMIFHRGPYDERPGVQLLITSLLGQIYGVLSKNPTIRLTSQAFHVLAFVWAKQCGISANDISATQPQSPSSDSEDEKDRFWRRWVARNIQQRALLAHYALDGLISRTVGTTPVERHLSNRLTLQGNENAFAAQTANAFMMQIQLTPPRSADLSFQAAFNQLFSTVPFSALLDDACTAFNFMVIQEGLQAAIAESDDVHCRSGDALQSTQLDEALLRIHESVANAAGLSNAEKLEATLRSHAICLERITSTSQLGRVICHAFNMQQSMSMHDDSPKLKINLTQWPHTADGRRALLHAVAIQAIIEDLPRGRAHAIHMPSALFAAASVCAAFCLAGVTTVNLPSIVSWDEVIVISTVEDMRNRYDPFSETRNFISGEFDSSRAAFGAYRNLSYEFNSIQKLFGCLATQWGIAGQMSSIVRQWAAMFSQRGIEASEKAQNLLM